MVTPIERKSKIPAYGETQGAKVDNVSEFVQLIENKEVLAESELMPCTWNNGMVE